MGSLRKYTVLVGVIMVLLTLGIGATAKETIVLGTWGGAYEALFKEKIIPLFEENYDCRVVVEVGSSTARMAKIAAQVNDQKMDVAMETAEALLAGIAQGVLEPLDPNLIPNLADVDSKFKDPFTKENIVYGSAVSWTAAGILWREDLVPFEITTWKDLWHRALEKKVILQQWPNVGAINDLIMAAHTYGGDQYNIDPGFEALKDLMPNIHHFFEISSQAPADLMSGEAWVAVTIAGRGIPYRDQGIRVTIPKEGTTYSLQGICIPKNTKHYELASKFVDFMLSPEIQKIWSCGLHYPPSNPKAELDPECQALMIETPETIESLWYMDFEYIAKMKEEWTERFNREVSY